MRILEQERSIFDWARVLAVARAWHVTMQVADTLGYLAAGFGADVPAQITGELEMSPVAAVDLNAYAALGTMPAIRGYHARPWYRYRLRTRELSAWRALPGFVRYLEVTLGLERWPQIPGEIIRRIGRFRCDRRAGRR